MNNTKFNSSPANAMPASQALAEHIRTFCPVDAHINVTMRATYVSGNVESFRGQFYSTETTHLSVVRAFSAFGITYWTREDWEHDNGYRCTLTVLTKAEFLALIHA